MNAATWKNIVGKQEEKLSLDIAAQYLGSQQPQFAEIVLKKVLSANPRNTRANELMAHIAGQAGDKESALHHLTQACRQPDCSPGALYFLGTAHLGLGKFPEAIVTLRRAVDKNAHFFEALHDLGLACALAGQASESIEYLTRALSLRPDSFEALTNLGNSLRKAGRFEESLTQQSRAIAVNPHSPECWMNRGVAHYELGHGEDALADYEQTLQLDPAYAEAWSNKGNALCALNRPRDALEAYAKAIDLRRDDYSSYWNSALAMMALGDYESGWPYYEYRWKRQNADTLRHTGLARLERLADARDKTIRVWSEQGFGDTLQFARYIPMLVARGAQVEFEVQPELFSLFDGQFDCRIVARGSANVEADFQIPLMSLPMLFGTRLETIPTPCILRIPSDKTRKWEARLPRPTGRLKLGIACRGSSRHENDRNRSMALAQFAPLLEFADLVVIQKDMHPDDLAFLECSPQISFPGADIGDFLDSAAIVMNMDMILSVDTSLAHLAGALDRPALILLPWAAEWRWLGERPDSPWYPHATLLRQPCPGDWHAVIAEAAEKLDAR
ncbi:tetratricopeptide repeat protein [Paludibacterium yongneupense]|uniref:tetratricopeptide repeat protein n=1 Tax=Paludibacterium yongneupense TaxID=400061 RepID=UPI00040544BC|nr:tetratricopeptide repeat protein [Paludibacterium yongneupense]